ncbi:MAG TPA: hypothetical protein VFE22_11000 [Edaphobacter sp.]|nr:hypothetical protein [Edaphobacter sp.]
MQTLLLLANMLALAVLTYIICRIVSAARRRAEENRLPMPDRQIPGRQIPERQISAHPNVGAETENKVLSPTPPARREEGLLEAPIAAPLVLAEESLALVHPVIREDLPYADPVDGMPFEPEEAVVRCTCGLAYRSDSVTWLADYYRGCCIHCGARVDLPKERS